jgi:hypothetical protein
MNITKRINLQKLKRPFKQLYFCFLVKGYIYNLTVPKLCKDKKKNLLQGHFFEL